MASLVRSTTMKLAELERGAKTRQTRNALTFVKYAFFKGLVTPDSILVKSALNPDKHDVLIQDIVLLNSPDMSINWKRQATGLTDLQFSDLEELQTYYTHCRLNRANEDGDDDQNNPAHEEDDRPKRKKQGFILSCFGSLAWCIRCLLSLMSMMQGLMILAWMIFLLVNPEAREVKYYRDILDLTQPELESIRRDSASAVRGEIAAVLDEITPIVRRAHELEPTVDALKQRFETAEQNAQALEGRLQQRFETAEQNAQALEGRVQQRFETAEQNAQALEGRVQQTAERLEGLLAIGESVASQQEQLDRIKADLSLAREHVDAQWVIINGTFERISEHAEVMMQGVNETVQGGLEATLQQIHAMNETVKAELEVTLEQIHGLNQSVQDILGQVDNITKIVLRDLQPKIAQLLRNSRSFIQTYFPGYSEWVVAYFDWSWRLFFYVAMPLYVFCHLLGRLIPKKSSWVTAWRFYLFVTGVRVTLTRNFVCMISFVVFNIVRDSQIFPWLLKGISFWMM